MSLEEILSLKESGEDLLTNLFPRAAELHLKAPKFYIELSECLRGICECYEIDAIHHPVNLYINKHESTALLNNIIANKLKEVDDVTLKHNQTIETVPPNSGEATKSA